MPTRTEAYLAALAPEHRQVLERLRELVREAAPAAEEAFGYGLPGYKLNGATVWLGAYKRHASLFIGHTVQDFATELAGYKVLRGTVQLPYQTPLPEPLIRTLVQARFNEGAPS